MISANATHGACYFAFYPESGDDSVDGICYNYVLVGDTETIVPTRATRMGIVIKFSNYGNIDEITAILELPLLNEIEDELEDEINARKNADYVLS